MCTYQTFYLSQTQTRIKKNMSEEKYYSNERLTRNELYYNLQ